MKEPNRKNSLHDEGYIPFELEDINKIKVFDSILILNDGNIFFGRSFGSKKTSIGEICFNTSLTGYQEIITDPSYANQIITFTFPHIGNIGTNNFDNESNTKSIDQPLPPCNLHVMEPASFRQPGGSGTAPGGDKAELARRCAWPRNHGMKKGSGQTAL